LGRFLEDNLCARFADRPYYHSIIIYVHDPAGTVGGVKPSRYMTVALWSNGSNLACIKAVLRAVGLDENIIGKDRSVDRLALRYIANHVILDVARH
jgi:hypothetical protein